MIRGDDTSAGANGIAGVAENLEAVGAHTGDGLLLVGIAKGNSRGDLARHVGGKRLGGVVDEHGALGVARNDDMGAGALGHGLLDKAGPVETVSNREPWGRSPADRADLRRLFLFLLPLTS